MSFEEITKELEALADPEHAALLQRFFKTGTGEYGEGDIFRGIRVPELRRLSKKYRSLSPRDAVRLLHSRFHEDRLTALFILALIYSKADESTRKKIYDLYLANTKYINNWDLVDCSAHCIVGAHLREKSKAPLTKLAKSPSLWERRIAVISTFHFIKHGELDHSFRIAEVLLRDPEDLIHKAVGWMLREAGKRDLRAEEEFLGKHYREMPRTMLRYAIEKFPEPKRKAYLLGVIQGSGLDFGLI